MGDPCERSPGDLAQNPGRTPGTGHQTQWSRQAADPGGDYQRAVRGEVIRIWRGQNRPEITPRTSRPLPPRSWFGGQPSPLGWDLPEDCGRLPLTPLVRSGFEEGSEHFARTFDEQRSFVRPKIHGDVLVHCVPPKGRVFLPVLRSERVGRTPSAGMQNGRSSRSRPGGRERALQGRDQFL